MAGLGWPRCPCRDAWSGDEARSSASEVLLVLTGLLLSILTGLWLPTPPSSEEGLLERPLLLLLLLLPPPFVIPLLDGDLSSAVAGAAEGERGDLAEDLSPPEGEAEEAVGDCCVAGGVRDEAVVTVMGGGGATAAAEVSLPSC